MTDPQQYVGKIVMVERAEPTHDYTRSYDGEKLVLQATPNQLFTISLSGYSSGINAYGLYNNFGNRVELTGAGRYNVLSVSDIPDWIFEELDRVEKEIEDALAGRVKPQWVSSVYTGAKANLQRLREFQKAQTQVKTTLIKAPAPSGAYELCHTWHDCAPQVALCGATITNCDDLCPGWGHGPSHTGCSGVPCVACAYLEEQPYCPRCGM